MTSARNNEPDTTVTGTVTGPTQFERFVQYAKDRAAVEGSLVGDELTESQMERILTATTQEELDNAMKLAGLTGLKDLADGTEIQINGYHLVPGSRSEFANKLGVFAVIDAQLVSNGAEIKLDTGILRIIGYLRMCEANGWFPVQRIVKKIPTGNGEMVTLEPLTERAIPVAGSRSVPADN